MRIIISLIFCFGILNAQHKNIKISELGSPTEPAIHINPTDTSQVIAGANINKIYLSNDGGYNWETIIPTSSYGVAGDPCLITDNNGQVYFFHLSNSVIGGWLDRIVCQKLDTETNTFNNGSYMGYHGTKDQDKEWAVVCPKTNNIYTTWTEFDLYRGGPNCKSRILFSKSTNEGDSWSRTKMINIQEGNCVDSDSTTEGAVPAVSRDGEIYVAWSFNEKIYFSQSIDEGDTWTSERAIADQIGGWNYHIPGIYRCNGLPVTKCDVSGGENDGTIYVNWTDQSNGMDDTDVWLIKSTDKGKSWTKPLKVNDDVSGNHQFLSWIDIDQSNGNIWMVWYDRRNYIDERTDLYAAFSNDGGETFANMKISDDYFLPTQSVFFGDYTNISAYNNKVIAAWCSMNNSKTSIYATHIDVDLVNEIDYFDKTTTKIQAFPNPFYDQVGNRMNDRIAKRFSAGEHTLELNDYIKDLNSGVYFIELKNRNKSLVTKLIRFE